MSQESLLKYEFIKEANIATGLSKFLLTTVPKFFKGIQGAAGAAGLTASNATAVRAATTIGGAGIGAGVGAAKAPEGQRGQGALKGAILGGAAGFGAGFGASKLPTLGNKVMEDASNIGKFLQPMGESATMNNKQVGRKLTDYLAGMKGTVTPVQNAENITMTPGLWRKGDLKPNIPTGRPTATEGRIEGLAKSAPGRGVAEVADFLKTTREKGLFRGTGDVLKRNIHEATRYNFDITPENVGNFPKGTTPGTYVFQRSGVGKALGVATMSGAGIGTTEALTASNEDGTPPTIGKRLRKGAVGTLSWGVAPRLTGAKMLAYDLPKSFMSGNKQPQVENYY